MQGVHIRGGVIAATLAAGPMAVLATALAGIATMTPLGPGVSDVPGLLLISIPFGAIIAFVPTLIGATALAQSGRANIGMRLPIMWLLIGAACGAPIGYLSGQEYAAASFMAVVGAGCAGICRLFTRWDD